MRRIMIVVLSISAVCLIFCVGFSAKKKNACLPPLNAQIPGQGLMEDPSQSPPTMGQMNFQGRPPMGQMNFQGGPQMARMKPQGPPTMGQMNFQDRPMGQMNFQSRPPMGQMNFQGRPPVGQMNPQTRPQMARMSGQRRHGAMGNFRQNRMGNPGKHDATALIPMLSKLDISDTQVEKIADLIKSQEDASNKLREKIKELRSQRQDFLITDTFDEKSFKAHATAIADSEVEMAVAKAKLYQSILGVLNNDQKKQLKEDVEKLKTARAEMKKRRLGSDNMRKFGKYLRNSNNTDGNTAK